IDVQSREVPDFLSRARVEAVHAVLAGTEKHAAGRDAWAGLGMTRRRKVPEFAARLGIQTVQLAVRVLVEALADVKPAIRDAGGGENLLQIVIILEGPK